MPKKWETPVRGQAQPGLGNRYATAAGTLSISSRKAKCHCARAVYTAASGAGGDLCDRLQILYLRRLHGLTETQAHALAALIWGALA